MSKNSVLTRPNPAASSLSTPYPTHQDRGLSNRKEELSRRLKATEQRVVAHDDDPSVAWRVNTSIQRYTTRDAWLDLDFAEDVTS